MTLGGKVFDVTVYPTAVFLKVQELYSNQKLTTESYREPLYMWLNRLDPTITREWVDEHTQDAKVIRTIESELFGKALLPLGRWTTDQDPEPDQKKKQASLS